jgi:hypothetical protein
LRSSGTDFEEEVFGGTRRPASGAFNRIAFSGRIRGRALPAGRYRAAFAATNSAGTSALRALSFRIVAP